MTEELDQQRPYEVFLQDNYYYFTTDNKVTYKIFFDDISPSEELPIYSVSLECMQPNPPLDNRTRWTTTFVLNEFFKQKENAVFYLCDVKDGKELVRKRKFEQWFTSSSFREDLEKIDYTLYEGKTTYHASLIFRKDNPKKEDIRVFYTDYTSSLEDK